MAGRWPRHHCFLRPIGFAVDLHAGLGIYIACSFIQNIVSF